MLWKVKTCLKPLWMVKGCPPRVLCLQRQPLAIGRRNPRVAVGRRNLRRNLRGGGDGGGVEGRGRTAAVPGSPGASSSWKVEPIIGYM